MAYVSIESIWDGIMREVYLTDDDKANFLLHILKDMPEDAIKRIVNEDMVLEWAENHPGELFNYVSTSECIRIIEHENAWSDVLDEDLIEEWCRDNGYKLVEA